MPGSSLQTIFDEAVNNVFVCAQDNTLGGQPPSVLKKVSFYFSVGISGGFYSVQISEIYVRGFSKRLPSAL
jgi:hypothetical protein